MSASQLDIMPFAACVTRMSPGYPHMNWRMARTSSRIAIQACIIFAGGNVCNETVKDVKLETNY
jgi:hypothetical protein